MSGGRQVADKLCLRCANLNVDRFKLQQSIGMREARPLRAAEASPNGCSRVALCGAKRRYRPKADAPVSGRRGSFRGVKRTFCRNLRCIFFRDGRLTLVPNPVTLQSSLIEGRGAEAHRVMGARAVPAGGFAACSRAAWASCLPALRPRWEVHPWTGTGEGG